MTNNQDEKTYTPKIDEGDKVLLIKNVLKNIDCNITKNSSVSNKTQNIGQTTGMIVYESPNLKNRVYAIIGLILVGITGIGFISYRFFKRKNATSAN